MIEKTQKNHTPIVEVTHLTSGYEDFRVLDDISIFAPEHQITIILGASGCGKTTLLKHLIRLIQPWSGSIRLFGHEITSLDEPEFNTILKDIGVMFQNGALLGSLSVAENVSIPMEQHTSLKEDMIRKLVEIKLDLVGLRHAIDLSPSELSGGMRKRAALARAIALDPPLLFGDEPSAGLDPVTSAGLDELILKMREQLGMTVVLVSHEVASINRIADHVVFLDEGKVLFCGPLKEAKTAGIQKVDDFFAKG
ncbi:ATP-binding cassette domain-containing protein [bacterium]|nr:ATP-binding cassette domain-containing protein [bacterium]